MSVEVQSGTLISDAASEAGLELNIPCGGQGRCGRCAVIVKGGEGIRRRSTMRLSDEDVAAGYALACQTVIEGDAVITIPPQEKIERRLVTDRTAVKVRLPFVYDSTWHQSLRVFPLLIDPPSLSDQTDDWSRLKRALANRRDIGDLTADLGMLQVLGQKLREHEWNVNLVVELDTWDRPEGPPRLVDVTSIGNSGRLCGVAVDIGTTTVSLYLVDLFTGDVITKEAEYNDQIRRGEDVISRIIYAGKKNGLAEMQSLVVGTINGLLEQAAETAGIKPTGIYKMTVSGNSTMIHLLLGVQPESIRLEPFITSLNQPPTVLAEEIGVNICPQATVDALPGVASYVGADISAGVVSTGMDIDGKLSLFLDVGTNGEMVLGDGDWLISCACSAGPAFEGAGVQSGMRATTGAIEEVWINAETYEPNYRVIQDPVAEAKGEQTKPRGICGSGLISLLSELFVTGVMDKAGNVNDDLPTERTRRGEHGAEYVVAWAGETAHGEDIVITKVDVDNLLRAKASIYAGFTVLADSVGIPLEMTERVLIGGSFGQYLNIEKAVQIGLLPDMPWEHFHFLGNTSLLGALLALLSRDYRERIAQAATRMTYLELSADNSFYEAFTSALFLPHTDIERFPSVKEIMSKAKAVDVDVSR